MTEVNNEGKELEQKETFETEKPKHKKVSLDDLKGELLTEEDAQDLKDYIRDLRDEAKKNRIGKKKAESKVKQIIGLEDDDEVDDAKIEAFKKAQNDIATNAITKANTRLITAEIKSLDGYDAKLVNRLLDKSLLEISEDGIVTGLQEAVEALAVEFPSVKVSVRRDGSNPPPPNTKTFDEQYEDLKKEISKHPGDSALMQKLFLMKERK